jgi:hypothetical protein
VPARLFVDHVGGMPGRVGQIVTDLLELRPRRLRPTLVGKIFVVVRRSDEFLGRAGIFVGLVPDAIRVTHEIPPPRCDLR